MISKIIKVPLPECVTMLQPSLPTGIRRNYRMDAGSLAEEAAATRPFQAEKQNLYELFLGYFKKHL
jgi:hypothetical protein